MLKHTLRCRGVRCRFDLCNAATFALTTKCFETATVTLIISSYSSGFPVTISVAISVRFSVAILAGHQFYQQKRYSSKYNYQHLLDIMFRTLLKRNLCPVVQIALVAVVVS
jgi:hypothetical protein